MKNEVASLGAAVQAASREYDRVKQRNTQEVARWKESRIHDFDHMLVAALLGCVLLPCYCPTQLLAFALCFRCTCAFCPSCCTALPLKLPSSLLLKLRCNPSAGLICALATALPLQLPCPALEIISCLVRCLSHQPLSPAGKSNQPFSHPEFTLCLQICAAPFCLVLYGSACCTHTGSSGLHNMS